MSDNAPSITFEPVQAAHLPLLAGWLNSPHIREWWGDPETELGYIRDMVEGRDPHCRPFIFYVDGEPTGYIQQWFIGPHQTPEWIADHPWLAALPADTVGVDLSVGRAECLSQGLGSHVLRIFVEDLRKAGYCNIIIDPDPANQRAIRAYEKAGFCVIPELVGDSGDSLIMRHTDRPGSTCK